MPVQIDVAPGQMADFVLDFDACKSVVTAGNSGRYNLKPVVSVIPRLVAGVSEAIRLPFPVATDQLRQLALDNIGATDAVERELGFVPQDMGGRLGYLRRKISQQ